jgi:hypothetical protein
VTAGDRPRFLHRDPGRGYTDSPYLAARHEPECVSEEEQRELTARAHRRWQQEQARAWGQAASEIGRAIETFVAEGHPAGQLLNDVKRIQRAVARAERHMNGPAVGP